MKLFSTRLPVGVMFGGLVSVMNTPSPWRPGVPGNHVAVANKRSADRVVDYDKWSKHAIAVRRGRLSCRIGSPKSSPSPERFRPR